MFSSRVSVPRTEKTFLGTKLFELQEFDEHGLYSIVITLRDTILPYPGF